MSKRVGVRRRPGLLEPGRGWSRGIAGSLALALAVTALAEAEPALAVSSAVHVGKASSRSKVKHYPSAAADLASARVLARLSGKKVEALSERTETSTTWVNANGSLTTELSAGPVRFKDAGKWRSVDLDLRAVGGRVEPKAHPRGLRLGGGQATSAGVKRSASAVHDLVTLGEGDRQIALQWKGDLPRPKLKGNRATYAGAASGADVVVEATRTGFEQYVVLGARPGNGYSYTLPLKAKGLKVRQLKDGSLLFTDRKGKKQATMPAPVMWDARVDKVSGEHTHRAPVKVKVVRAKGTIDLVFTPDAKFLADPKTQYLVTVDPRPRRCPTCSTPTSSRARRSTGPPTSNSTWATRERPTATAHRARPVPSSTGTPSRSRTRWSRARN